MPYLRSQSPFKTGQNDTPCFLSPLLGLYPTHTLTGVHNNLDIQLSISTAASCLIENTGYSVFINGKRVKYMMMNPQRAIIDTAVKKGRKALCVLIGNISKSIINLKSKGRVC